MESQREDDNRLNLVSDNPLDSFLYSYLLILAFILERLGLYFSLNFPDQCQNSLGSAGTFGLLISNIIVYIILKSLLKPLSEVLGLPPFKGRRIFYIERCTNLLAAIYFYFGCRSCRILATVLFCFTNSILFTRFMLFIGKIVHDVLDISGAKFDLTAKKLNEEPLQVKEEVEQKQELVREDKFPKEKVEAELVEDKLPGEKVEFDHERLKSNDSNDHDKEEDEDEDNQNDRKEKEKEDEIPKFEDVDCYKIFPDFESEKEPITDYKQQCLILEEENKDLNAKLVAAAESLEHYLQIEKNYLEDRNKWETEKNNLSKLESWYKSWVSYYGKAAYNYHLDNQNILKEKNELSAKLQSANSSAEFYKAESHKLREEKDNRNRNVVQVTEVKNRYLPHHYLELEEKNRMLNKAEQNKEYYHNLVRVMGEKNRKVNEEMQEKLKQLEIDKCGLAAKLAAAKSKSEFYLSYLQDRGF